MECRCDRTGPNPDDIPREGRAGLVRDNQADLDCGTHIRARPRCPQGVRFRTARPCAGSAGTETWSCTTSQTPSICRKHAVQRNHMLTGPLGSVLLMWLRLCTKASSPFVVTVRSGTS